MASGGPITTTRRPGTRGRKALAAMTALAGLLVAVPGSPAEAQTAITVTSTGDASDTDPGDGRCRTDGGRCSLRAAIEEANARPGPDRIVFAIDGTGVKTIVIGSTLTLNDPTGGTTIDGYTQTGASPNTHVTRFDASVMIELTTAARPDRMVLIESAENTIRGLSIHGNGTRIELAGESADGNVIAGNIIGTDPGGAAVSSSSSNRSNAGVVMNLGPDRNVIGGPTRADRNIIANNGARGIRINHGETSENVIANNIIGLSPGLDRSGNQTIGIDLQWWTWGNHIAGNLISGNEWYAIDLSHSAIGNTVVDNRMGTGPGGNGGNARTANRIGVALKDNPLENVVAGNVIANSTSDGIWQRHNNNGRNVFLDNRIGVGVDGAAIGNGGYGIHLRGHDGIYLGNIIANNEAGGVYVTDSTNGGTRFPPEKTERNVIGENTFYGSADPFIDIEGPGPNGNDRGDGDDGAHLLLNHPTVTGIGPGQLYGRACGGCVVDVAISGRVSADGSLDVDSTDRGTGAAWIGRAQADDRGRFSLAEDRLRAGKDVRLVAVDADGNTSEPSPAARVPARFDGNGSGAAPSIGPWDRPAVPDRPDPYVGSGFQCRLVGATLSWTDAGAGEYYVFFSVDGTEGYIGPIRGTSVPAPMADSYRVEHWVSGFATNATCPGAGVPSFRCSFQAGTLSWSDVGAEEYYAFAVVGGVERYLGAVRGTSVLAPAAEQYRVEHWLLGPATNTRCRP